ncbi:uncharacterized protein TrAFT101_004540 [Trichoderma asperellum]|uniref:uncharacterized protein n=1 Tax=Trichoderma asperellum TaxID=101201 RepID=UPI00332D66C1|nr:hypothetical protein TrAFT101_004540 [Trichoderma asperellum]
MRLGRMRCLSRASGVSKPCLARDEVDGDFEEKGTEKKLLLDLELMGLGPSAGIVQIYQ